MTISIHTAELAILKLFARYGIDPTPREEGWGKTDAEALEEFNKVDAWRPCNADWRFLAIKLAVTYSEEGFVPDFSNPSKRKTPGRLPFQFSLSESERKSDDRRTRIDLVKRLQVEAEHSSKTDGQPKRNLRQICEDAKDVLEAMRQEGTYYGEVPSAKSLQTQVSNIERYGPVKIVPAVLARYLRWVGFFRFYTKISSNLTVRPIDPALRDPGEQRAV